MATGKSGTKTLTSSTMGVQISWSETYDPINNTSTVSITDLKLMCRSYYGTFFPHGTIRINGTVVNQMSSTLGTHNVYISSVGSYATVVTHSSYASDDTYHGLPYSKSGILHDTNGEKTISIAVTLNLYNSNGVSRGSITESFNIDLTAIDRIAPSVSIIVTPKSSTSLEIKATSSYTCDLWEYSLDGGSTWTTYSTDAALSNTKTLTGLTSKNYTGIKVRARKRLNHLTGTSSAESCDLIAPSVTLTVTPLTSTSLKLQAWSSYTSDLWEYTLDGSTWTTYSTTAALSNSITLTGLTSKNYNNIKVRARKRLNQLTGTSAANSCDLTLSTVSFTISSITANSFYVAASSGETCKKWEYSKDDGSTWVVFSSSEGKSASTTVSGLSPNTTYQVKVRVTKKANSLTSTASAQSVKTLGGTVINSVSAFEADVSNPVLPFNWTVYDPTYKHTLTIKKGNTVILSFTDFRGSVGTNNITINLTATQRNTLLAAMANEASFTATYVLSTYDADGNQIGSTSTKTGTIKATAATSAPTVNSYSYSDANDTTSELMDGAPVDKSAFQRASLQKSCTLSS